MSLVDVVIPVYNTPLQAVEQALRSVVSQTFTQWRAMVVDDGSSHEFAEALDVLVSGIDDSRVELHRTMNGGVAAARNYGIRISNSPFVALLDSDDIWHPSKLELQVSAMRQWPDIALVHTGYARFYGSEPTELMPICNVEERVNALSPEEACVAMLRRNFVGVSTVMLRRALCDESGYFDPSFRTLEDKELWVRLLMQGLRFHLLPQPLMFYRMHQGNISKNVGKMLDGRLSLISKVDDAAPRAPVWFASRWPAVMREMLRNAHLEAAETLLEGRQYLQALEACQPGRSGLSRRSAAVALRSMGGLLGMRP